MKNIKNIFGVLSVLLIANSCQMDGINTDVAATTTASSNLAQVMDVSQDNSGLVKITPKGEGVSSFKVSFGDGTGASSSAIVTPGSSVTHKYAEGNYNVTIDSYDVLGNVTSKIYPLVMKFVAPSNLQINTNLSGYVLNVSLAAKYATGGFQIYFGDVANENPTKVSGTYNSTTGMIEAETVSHTYAPGNYTLKVVALSGGAATTTMTQNVQIFKPFGLPVTFDDPNQNYGYGGTFGGVDASVVNNPFSGGINTSAHVFKFTKNSGAETWAGTWTPLGAPNGVPINIDNGTKFKMMVYATETGKSLHFQLEDGTDYKPAVDVPITVANQWQELTFDFSSLGIAAGHVFNQYVFQYNLSGNGAGEVIYIDNITQSN